jgi:ribosomal protein S18 acetylase RimI-like enzyme
MTTDALALRWLGTGDEAVLERAGRLFDGPPRRDWIVRFLTQPGHHLCIAYVGDQPAGFVSGIEMTHPDKGTEMFLYELGVDEAFRGRGIGRALVRALTDRASELGCHGMWVLTEHDNGAALATYRSAGSTEESDHVMLGWDLDEPHRPA